MKLSEHFTAEEMTHTDTGLYNYPDANAIEKLLYLAAYVLEPLRAKFGPIQVTSGYRSDAVNKAVGGAPQSQHRKGEASDIIPLQANLDEVFQWGQVNLHYGQLILESKNGKRWIHVSLLRVGGMNQQALIMTNGSYREA